MSDRTDFNQYLKRCLAEDPDLAAAYRELKLDYDVASLVIKMRIERGLTHAELAAQCGLSEEDILLLESGDAKSVPLDKLQAIATQLGCKLHIDAAKE